MDDLDFSNMTPAPTPEPAKTAPPAPPAAAKLPPAPEPVSLYQPKLALAFFKLAGKMEQFAAGAQIFAEDEKTSGFFSKGARIYLLLDGEVMLTRGGKPLDLVPPGEIFGEMAAIAEIPRSAAATVRKNCRVLSLDQKAFIQSLQQMPEFALMLMSVLAQRLRRGLGRLAALQQSAVEPLAHSDTLDRKMLADLRKALGDPAPATAAAGQVVVNQGAVGACMFIVTEGSIAISVDNKVVERVGPGGSFGEMALVERSGRSATAVAETDSAWLLVGRNEFLDMVRSSPAFGVALMRSMSARVLHIGKLLGG